MSDLKQQYKIHFVYRNKIIQEMSYNIPRVGDEVRLSKNKFYTVKRIVWIFDEKFESHYSRVNIELTKVKE